jgi:hypothetical protein
MSIRLFSAKKLAEELGQGRLSTRSKAHYLFAGFVMWLVINVTGFSSVSPLWTWMSIIETAALLLITLLGFQSAYDAAGGDDNADFVAQFTCLYVPVSITTVIVVWGGYWGVLVGFRETVMALSESRMQFAVNLGKIGSSLFGALVTLAVLATQAITFYRITKLFRLLRSQTGTASQVHQNAPLNNPA